MEKDQSIKEDNGKPKISLVPPKIIYDIAKVREYGLEKYGTSESWKKVEVERYWDAYLRHTLACFDDLKSVDEESGLPHLYHAACNLAFMLELLAAEAKTENEPQEGLFGEE